MERLAKPRALPRFAREPLPKRFCNFERLIDTMEARGLDGIALASRNNVFYLTGFNTNTAKAEEPPIAVVILSRHEPDHPIVVVPELFLTYFLHQPTWVEDIRPYRTSYHHQDLPVDSSAIDRFIPQASLETPWINGARDKYALSMTEACNTAMQELGLDSGRIGFDDLRLAGHMATPDIEVIDAYGPLMFVRQAKTKDELHLLRQAALLNQAAIERTVKAWQPGSTWRELNHVYNTEAAALGGFSRDPGAITFANPPGMDPAVTVDTGLEDYEIVPGTNVMFDCHGTWSGYCWDGGKTWAVGDEPKGRPGQIARATAEVMTEIEAALVPGRKISELQALARRIYKALEVPHPESVFTFFHGLGLSHLDREGSTYDRGTDPDWAMTKDMVVAIHLLYPGDERHRVYLEDAASVTDEGGESLYTWDFDLLTGP